MPLMNGWEREEGREGEELPISKPCFTESQRIGGKVVVKPPKEVVDVGISKGEASLVGQFLDKAPPFMVVKQYVDGLWSQFGRVEIFAIDNDGFNLGGVASILDVDVHVDVGETVSSKEEDRLVGSHALDFFGRSTMNEAPQPPYLSQLPVLMTPPFCDSSGIKKFSSDCHFRDIIQALWRSRSGKNFHNGFITAYRSLKRSARRTDQWATSKKLDSHKTGSGHVRRTLNYSTTEVRDRSPAKERTRNRVNVSKRKNPDYSSWSPDSRSEDYAETSCTQPESRSLTPQAVSKQPLESGGHSRSRPPLHHQGRGPQTKEQVSRKAARAREHHAVWKALDLVSSSPFSREIEEGRTIRKIHSSAFRSIQQPNRPNGPYILREVALRWFNQLDKRTIKSWIRMAETFVARFITNSRRTKEMDALLSKKLEDNETIKDYSTRFWETYNDIDGCGEEVAVRTFKLGKKDTGSVVRQPDSSDIASAEVIHVIHNPLCSSILPSSYRSEIQKAAHLRRSHSISDSIHLALLCSITEGVWERTISFSDSDLKDIQLPHNNPLVITLRIGNYDVKRVLVDQRSFAEVVY
uniref:Retrotransposon gag domain-containing protein n=1 Tax=Fagus sylvatica TaxID=28930 RepID=A0A2N9GIV8_FAGSY